MTDDRETQAAGGSLLDSGVRPLVERLRAAALPGTRRHALDEEAAAEVERLRDELQLCCELKRLYQAQAAAKVDRSAEDHLRRALHEIAEEWAGAECGEPVHAQEAYAIGLAQRMYELAAAALRHGVAFEPLEGSARIAG